MSKGLESKELLVYRRVPILKIKQSDNPEKYRYMSPLGARDELEKIHDVIDKKLDKEEKKSQRERKKPEDNAELTYFKKWENCQMELDLMKKREAEYISQLKKLEARVDEISKSNIMLQKEAADLRQQAKESREILERTQKK